jgi:hypothetical protein
MAYTNVNDLSTLVTVTEVKNTIASANFDGSLITNDIIKIAEITHIEKTISREFYEELVTQHHAASLNPYNQTLMDDYLVRTLSWFVKLEVLNDVMYSTTSSGIMQNIDDFSTGVSPKQFDLIKQDVSRKANLFLQDMLDFLNDDAIIVNYPTYKSNRTEVNVMNNDTTNKAHGIIFH